MAVSGALVCLYILTCYHLDSQGLICQTLIDLNDFITPSQACIKPVEQVKSSEEIAKPGDALVSMVILVSSFNADAYTDSNSRGFVRKLL